MRKEHKDLLWLLVKEKRLPLDFSNTTQKERDLICEIMKKYPKPKIKSVMREAKKFYWG